MQNKYKGLFLIKFTRISNFTGVKKCLTNNLFTPFINIKWSKSDVLQETIDNIAHEKIKLGFLKTKIDIDTISDIKKII